MRKLLGETFLEILIEAFVVEVFFVVRSSSSLPPSAAASHSNGILPPSFAKSAPPEGPISLRPA